MKPFTIRATFFLLLLAYLIISNPLLPVQGYSDKIIFGVIGDYGLASQNEADVANLVKSWNPDFIVTVGDNNYPSGSAWSIDQNIGQYYHEYIYPYKGKYGNGSATKRFFPALGNHDWGVNRAKPHLNYFDPHKQKTFYDFVQGPVHFFILNSNKEEPDGVSSTSPQARWLKKGLAASTSAFNVVVFHHPPYSSGRHGSNTYMRWPFKNWGADVIFSGHDHIYERLLVDGIPYFVNGIGGADLYYFETILPESQVRFNQDFGAMRMEATSTYMKFQMITRAGVLIDEYIIGESNPSVTAITLTSQSPTNSNYLTFQVTFSEAVTGVDISDFTLSSNINGATIHNVSGSGNTYVVSVNSGNGDGTLRLDLTDNDLIINSMGNSLGGLGLGNGNFTNGETYIVDKSVPNIISITRASPNPTNATNVDFSVTFSEPVTGLDPSDFSLVTSTGAQINSVNGTGNTYLVSVATSYGDDTLRLDFNGNDSVVDLAGNSTSASFSSGETYIIDRSMPFVTSIIRAKPDQINASSLDYIVSFSEAVDGVDGSDFSVSTLNGATITNVIGAGNIYTVTLSTRPGNDTIRLDLIDDDSIIDNTSNRLGDVGIGNGNFTNGETYTISQGAPFVTSIVRASPDPSNAASVDFIVTFSEPVDGVDITDFILAGNSNAAIININNVNPFYVVTVNTGSSEVTLRLDLIDDDSIHNTQGVSLGGDGAGNANYTNGEIISIDRTPPRVTSIIRASSNPSINPSVDFIVTFSESVTGVDTSDFFVTTTNTNSFITNFQNADPFYVVSVNTGAGLGTVRLDLIDNSTITDHAGNRLADNGTGYGSFTTGEAFTIAKTTVNFPAPKILDMPRNLLTNNPVPHFAWTAVRNAQAYEIFIALDANFTKVVLTETTNKTEFSQNSPLADGTYYMRVRAFNAYFNPGKFSKTYTYSIDTTPPRPPTLFSPPNNTSSSSRPSLQWKVVDDIVQYQIELDNNPDFSSPEFTGTTRKTSIRTKFLSRQTYYYWRVREKDKAGNWSDWSTSFTIYIR